MEKALRVAKRHGYDGVRFFKTFKGADYYLTGYDNQPMCGMPQFIKVENGKGHLLEGTEYMKVWTDPEFIKCE